MKPEELTSKRTLMADKSLLSVLTYYNVYSNLRSIMIDKSEPMINIYICNFEVDANLMDLFEFQGLQTV